MSFAIINSSPRLGNLHIHSARKPVSPVDRVRVNARNIIRKHGVSALLAFWDQELSKRPAEAREVCWKALLPLAVDVVKDLFAREGEHFDAGFMLYPELPDKFSPLIWAEVAGTDLDVEWFVNPAENVLNGWDREVHV